MVHRQWRHCALPLCAALQPGTRQSLFSAFRPFFVFAIWTCGDIKNLGKSIVVL